MAAPSFVPTEPVDEPRAYRSPRHVPDAWSPDRPGDLAGRQPVGTRLGFQGPDQGYAVKLANGMRGRLQLTPGESADDAVRGCLNVALRRASLFGRAPVIHDLTIAFTIWGFLDAAPPAELVARRKAMFAGLGHTAQHYAEGREVAESIPEATLRMTPAQVAQSYPSGWAKLVGA